MGRWHSVVLVVGVLGGCLAPAAEAQTCEAVKGWFKSPPEVGLQGKLGQIRGGEHADCRFHRWAWETFFWLVQPGSGDGRIRLLEDMRRPDEWFVARGGPGPFLDELGARGRPFTLDTPRTEKRSDPKRLADIVQPGQGSILVDRHGQAVYYATHVNQEYADFILQQKFHTLDGYRQNGNAVFPPKSLALKSSWRVLPPDERDPGGFFVTRAKVASLTCADQAMRSCRGGQIKVGPIREARVALVGLHVVGRVEDHAEFIWATFEHDRNAPELGDISPNDARPVSDQDFTFYRAGTSASKSNMSNAGKVNLSAGRLSPPTDVFRLFAFGSSEERFREPIRRLNEDVRAKLAGSKTWLDVWKRYHLLGAVWFAGENQLEPGMSWEAIEARQIAAGSTRLSNTTMETFTQQVAPSCFACHNTGPIRVQGEALERSVNLSHIVRSWVTQQVDKATAQPAPRK